MGVGGRGGPGGGEGREGVEGGGRGRGEGGGATASLSPLATAMGGRAVYIVDLKQATQWYSCLIYLLLSIAFSWEAEEN